MGYIPNLSDEQLSILTSKIKPTRRFDGVLRYIQPVDIERVAFTWEPIPSDEAIGLEMVQDIKTYHSYGYYGFFKPSIAEVLKQIPNSLIDDVVAFEIIKSPETAEDLNDDLEALNAGYHVATTRLYKKSNDQQAKGILNMFHDYLRTKPSQMLIRLYMAFYPGETEEGAEEKLSQFTMDGSRWYLLEKEVKKIIEEKLNES